MQQHLCIHTYMYIYLPDMYPPLQFLSLSLSLSFSQIFFSLSFLLCLPQFVQISITLASWKFSLANSSLNLRRIEFSSKSLSLSLSLFYYQFFYREGKLLQSLDCLCLCLSLFSFTNSSSPLQQCQKDSLSLSQSRVLFYQ